ncbi:retrovirus-related pol polyprotein from transposon TNT 1-94 [Tanacetum coccineum]
MVQNRLNLVNLESQSSELRLPVNLIIVTKPSELVSEPVVNESNVEYQPKVWSNAPIIEEYESNSEDEYVSIPKKQQEIPSFAKQQVKTPRENVKSQFTHSQKPKVDKKDLGYGFTVRACFVCGSLNHLIRDCDFHEKRMARKANLNSGWNKKTSQKELRETWNNVKRVNKQNQFVPSAVLTRTGKIPVSTARASSTKNFSTARQSFNRQTVLTSTAMKVNTVKPIVNRVRPANVFHKTHSPSSRPFKKTTVLRTDFSKQKVNTAKVNAVSTVGGKRETAVKPSAGSKRYITSKGKIKTGKLDFEDVCFVKELQHFNLFSDSESLVLSSEFKLPDENQAITDESNKWHRRLGHVNFKNLNKLVKGNLLRGLPSKLFQNDHTCVASVQKRKATQSLLDVIEFCGSKGIKREYSNARTPQQNGVVERKNRTLIEAARTMLADSFLPNTFWAEAVKDESAQDCFVLPIWPSYSSTITPTLKIDDKREGPREEEHVFMDELERLKRQEKEANENTPAKASSTNLVNTISIPVSTAIPHEGLSPTNPEEDGFQKYHPLMNVEHLASGKCN